MPKHIRASTDLHLFSANSWLSSALIRGLLDIVRLRGKERLAFLPVYRLSRQRGQLFRRVSICQRVQCLRAPIFSQVGVHRGRGSTVVSVRWNVLPVVQQRPYLHFDFFHIFVTFILVSLSRRFGFLVNFYRL